LSAWLLSVSLFVFFHVATWIKPDISAVSTIIGDIWLPQVESRAALAIMSLLVSGLCFFVAYDTHKLMTRMNADEYIRATAALFSDPVRLAWNLLAEFSWEDAYGL
jgi:hypothetical protein